MALTFYSYDINDNTVTNATVNKIIASTDNNHTSSVNND